MELKTNEDGKSVIDVLPTGSTMLLQIIAKGYQTYGKEYKIDKSDMSFGIRMKRPASQYSIYKDHNQAADQGGKKGDADGQKPPSDKPADSGSQSTAPPSKPQ